MEPIILILKGWEMACAFQHEMCLKISCEFQPEVENSSGSEQSSLFRVSSRMAFIPRERAECYSPSRGPGQGAFQGTGAVTRSQGCPGHGPQGVCPPALECHPP